MKSLSKFGLILFLLFISSNVTAQISTKGVTNDLFTNSPAFIDFSKIYYSAGNNESKGMIVPSVNLGTFVFQYDSTSSTDYPTFFDGMVVYNNATSATTVTTGDNPSTSVAVSPGFYYFSNPNGEANGSLTAGVWTPLGGPSAAIKSKTVIGVVADGLSATLNLGTAVIAANEVVELVGAKVYNAAGDLVIGAFSDYTKATNVLTTGSGFVYSVMPAGTYKVVVEYR